MRNHLRTTFKKSLWVCFFACVALLLGLEPLNAQGLRDPTLPPAPTGLANPVTGEKSLSSDRGPLTIVVREGRRYVVLGTRLYAQGQRFGEARVERISETEVWFLEKGVVHKVSRFPDILRRSAAPVAALPVCASPTRSPIPSSALPQGAACADLRP